MIDRFAQTLLEQHLSQQTDLDNSQLWLQNLRSENTETDDA